MTIESATYISSLNASNPSASDPKSEGDDHIRLLKSTVKATFPNVSGAVTPTHTELNFVDGVTSAIQTQLDAKASLTGIETLTNKSLTSPTITGTGTIQASTITTTGSSTLGDSAAADVHAINGATTLAVNSASTGLTITQSGAGLALAITGGATISRTGVTSPATADGNVFSGTYTPTLTNTTNIASSTAFECHYMRVGNIVTIGGCVTIDPTATGSVVLGMTIPVASNFTSFRECGGTHCDEINSQAGRIFADIVNDRMSFQFNATDVNARTHSFTATYKVV